MKKITVTNLETNETNSFVIIETIESMVHLTSFILKIIKEMNLTLDLQFINVAVNNFQLYKKMVLTNHQFLIEDYRADTVTLVFKDKDINELNYRLLNNIPFIPEPTISYTIRHEPSRIAEHITKHLGTTYIDADISNNLLSKIDAVDILEGVDELLSGKSIILANKEISILHNQYKVIEV